MRRLAFSEFQRRYVHFKGISNKRRAYRGPDVVQIDLTDKCNSHCLACWLHSPLAGRMAHPDWDQLEYSKVLSFISDIKRAGSREIIFSGGGEPFCFQQIWEVLAHCQQLKMPFRIHTNFTLLDEAGIRRLLQFDKLLSLAVSLWDPETQRYATVHGRNGATLELVERNLILLNRLKPAKVKVKICMVVNNLNYLSLTKMAEFAMATGCDFVEFSVTDVIPGVTDTLLLNKEQLAALKTEFIGLFNMLKLPKNKLKVENADIFLRRISCPGAALGEYDSGVENTPCYAGWFFLRLRANGDYNSCLKSHRVPVGNIYKDSFSSVWNNPAQQEFRQQGLTIVKDRDYFSFIGNAEGSEIGCRRVCDNYVVNAHMHKILRPLLH